MKYYIKEMRIHHYIKNLLIFIPLACSGKLFNFEKIIITVFAFLSFCFISSAIYIINDIQDIEKDKKHPVKCNRPIAKGKITVKSAIICVMFLILFSIGFNILCKSLFSSLLLTLYFLINLGYSFGLKNIPLLDIIILVTGFLIRVLYGAIVTDINISNWLYLVVISVSFYLGLGKRRNELNKYNGEKTRNVIQKYSLNFLNHNMYMCMTLIFVFYALWTVDEVTMTIYHNSPLIWTVPVVILIFMKYSLTIEGDSEGDPVEVLIHDKVLIILCILYLLLMFTLLYIIK
ncbi:decaprenyl-phosphate phosphoribosyltransferase [bacterium]|nr:decaprenyl-phosphate phosphoribosyltransferase [bacterium]